MRGALALCCVLSTACATTPRADAAPRARVGPERGTLFIAGGGNLGLDMIERFIQLAGGPDAPIVVIPTAATEDTFPESWPTLRMLREAGARNLTVLHTRSRDTADSREFTAPLRAAGGVWISGGRQWRLADVYNDTRTVAALRGVLERGGVIGGTSAGASVQASYMVRGAPQSNRIVMAPGHETGFGLLPNTAIDQHLTARGRQNDMLEVIRRHPTLLGIGIDEGTAIIVTGDRATVAGRGRVAFYNTADADALDYYFLPEGGTFDLARRVAIEGTRIPPHVIEDESEVVATMNRLFDAMRARDTAAMRTLLHPELRIMVPQERGGERIIRISTPDQMIAQVSRSVDRLDERPIRPEVRVDGALATIWTYYEFVVGSNFSHCGTDAFHLIRTESGWVVTGLTYTVRTSGCRR